jgi:hypothetical protein
MAVCELAPAELDRRAPWLARIAVGDCLGDLRWYEAHIVLDPPLHSEATGAPMAFDTSGYRCARHLCLLAATSIVSRAVS